MSSACADVILSVFAGRLADQLAGNPDRMPRQFVVFVADAAVSAMSMQSVILYRINAMTAVFIKMRR